MFKNLSPKTKWRLFTAFEIIGAVGCAVCIFISEYLELTPSNDPYRTPAIVFLLLFALGFFKILTDSGEYAREIYDPNKLEKRHSIIKVCISLFVILLIAGFPAGAIIAVIFGVGKLPANVMSTSIVTGVFIGAIGIWLSAKWGIPPKKHQNAHTDTLKFINFEEFKLTAKNHYNSKGYEIFYYADDSNPECVTAFYKNIDGKYIDLIFIADINKLTFITHEDLQDVFSNITNMVTSKMLNCSTVYTTVIISPKQITNYLYEYLNKNAVLVKTYSTLLITALSFSERKVYISKMLEGHGLRGYKVALSHFCDLLKIETPNFRKRKRENKNA